MVEVIGLRPPNGSKWFLTVHEDPAGVPERFPRFRPEQHIDVRSIDLALYVSLRL